VYRRAMLTKHCWKCGVEYKLATPGRSETCDCGADLKVCLNCASYDRSVAYQCRDRRADPVEEKHLANYCEYFEFARRVFVKPTEEKARTDKARDQFKKLLGD
jgi:ribosome-binding protein aMBF1 (putative translation factor)